MQAITIGAGPYRKLADYSAARMREMTGLETTVIDENDLRWWPVEHPAWQKLWLMHMHRGRDLLIFDADIFCMKEWQPEDFIQEYEMAAVPDMASQQVLSECQLYGIGWGNYFNAGLMIVDGTIEVMYDAQQYHPRYGSWLEQTAINKACWDAQVNINYMPRAYNRLLWPGRDSYEPADLKGLNVVNLHFASMGGQHEQILEMMKKL